jgi:DsbC/DsbD-like thiol-disulfide interchange protein
MFQYLLSRPGRTVAALGVVAGIFALATADRLYAQNQKSDSKVKTTVKAATPDADGKQTITLTLNIEKGWHLYANPVDNETFAENKTIVTVSGKVKPQAVKVAYPKGTLHQDKILKESYLVYEDQVVIPVHVHRAAGDTGPLQVTIQVNACNDKLGVCLQPGKINLTVP